MKTITATISLLLLSSNAFANLHINQACLVEAKKNAVVKEQLQNIKYEIAEYSLDNSKGFNEATAQALANMICAPFSKSAEKAQLDLCNDIDKNVKAYKMNSNDGFSEETAKTLNSMANANCL